MVDLKLKQQVIELYIKGESERQITKVLPISRNTVRKYLKEFKQSRESDVRNLPIPEAITNFNSIHLILHYTLIVSG